MTRPRPVLAGMKSAGGGQSSRSPLHETLKLRGPPTGARRSHRLADAKLKIKNTATLSDQRIDVSVKRYTRRRRTGTVHSVRRQENRAVNTSRRRPVKSEKSEASASNAPGSACDYEASCCPFLSRAFGIRSVSFQPHVACPTGGFRFGGCQDTAGLRFGGCQDIAGSQFESMFAHAYQPHAGCNFAQKPASAFGAAPSATHAEAPISSSFPQKTFSTFGPASPNTGAESWPSFNSFQANATPLLPKTSQPMNISPFYNFNSNPSGGPKGFTFNPTTSPNAPLHHQSGFKVGCSTQTSSLSSPINCGVPLPSSSSTSFLSGLTTLRAEQNELAQENAMCGNPEPESQGKSEHSQPTGQHSSLGFGHTAGPRFSAPFFHTVSAPSSEAGNFFFGPSPNQAFGDRSGQVRNASSSFGFDATTLSLYSAFDTGPISSLGFPTPTPLTRNAQVAFDGDSTLNSQAGSPVNCDGNAMCGNPEPEPKSKSEHSQPNGQHSSLGFGHTAGPRFSAPFFHTVSAPSSEAGNFLFGPSPNQAFGDRSGQVRNASSSFGFGATPPSLCSAFDTEPISSLPLTRNAQVGSDGDATLNSQAGLPVNCDGIETDGVDISDGVEVKLQSGELSSVVDGMDTSDT